jgi:hypothetical protein
MSPRKPGLDLSPLRLKVGQPGPDTKIESVNRAAAAFANLAPEFEGWLENTIRRLDTARDGYLSDPDSAYLRSALLRRAVDIKSLGAMIGYPLVTRIGGSLVRMMDMDEAGQELPAALLDRHIKILYAIHKARARGTNSAQFSSLVADLDRDVSAIRSLAESRAPSRRQE